MDRFHTVNRLWWSLFLAASLLLNIGFAVNYMRTASQLNIAWYDTTGQFSHAAFLAGSFSYPVINESSINMALSELGAVRQYLKQIRNLPFNYEIIPYENMEKIRILLNYHQQALELARAELAESGEVSEESLTRLESAGEVWVALVTDLQPGFLAERLAANRPLFLKGTWRKIWDEAVDPAFAEAKLIPLPR